MKMFREVAELEYNIGTQPILQLMARGRDMREIGLFFCCQ